MFRALKRFEHYRTESRKQFPRRVKDMRFPGLASAALLLIILSVLSVFAQTSTGEVNGTITDPNGGSVPGAAVKLINQATDIETVLKTNDSGYFTFVNVKPA